MRSHQDRMLAGEPYDASDPQLVAARMRARGLCQAINALPPTHERQRADLLTELFGAPTNVYVTPPFFCDYGRNITLGRNVYFNFNCIVLDVAPVRVGDNVLFGPAVQIYTATHPLDAAERRSGIESAKAIVIGDDVWIGGGAILNPGVTVGARSVIGAGSVVTRDIPEDVFRCRQSLQGDPQVGLSRRWPTRIDFASMWAPKSTWVRSAIGQKRTRAYPPSRGVGGFISRRMLSSMKMESDRHVVPSWPHHMPLTLSPQSKK